jgi:hypothetical protein
MQWSDIQVRFFSRHASLSETVWRVSANFQYPVKERRIQFQNSWNWISIHFYFTQFQGA